MNNESKKMIARVAGMKRDELITELKAMRAKCVDGPLRDMRVYVWVDGNGYNDSETFGTYSFDGDEEMEKANTEFLMALFNSFETLVGE